VSQIPRSEEAALLARYRSRSSPLAFVIVYVARGTVACLPRPTVFLVLAPSLPHRRTWAGVLDSDKARISIPRTLRLLKGTVRRNALHDARRGCMRVPWAFVIAITPR
jgi:hypothetical protein